MIQNHKEIYNLFGYGIYQKSHSIFKLKYYKFYHRNIGLFGGKDIIMARYFVIMQRYLHTREVLTATTLSDKFSCMTLNSKYLSSCNIHQLQ